ncbi:MAG: aspartate/glutamate racemase family protein [Burkholderiales bacterium]|nr:aspartate/glutamate racemase family protein [Burkholderiales bacterium]
MQRNRSLPRTLIGMLTPSSNTALEPITTMMLAGVPGVTAHFGRFRVTQIALNDRALKQFDDSNILTAAELLNDAELDVIAWNGTSSGWLGFESDELLCRRITERTGVPAGTSVLALNEIFRATGVTRFGLVTPYTDDVQSRIVANYARHGFECVAERHLGLSHNFSFSEVTDDQLRTMIRAVAQSRPQAITTFCTNLHAMRVVEEMEQETGIPIYDTIATVLWKCLKITGVDPARVKGWGRLFREVK